MRIRPSFFSACALAGVVIALGAYGFVDQDQRIVFDKSNYLIFEDVGRVTTKYPDGSSYIQNSEFIRLHIHRDDATYDWDLTGGKMPTPYRFAGIRYASRDYVWAYSHFHAGHGLNLLNIAEKRLVSHVECDWEEISPDGSKAAMVFNRDYDSKGPLLVVNDTLVFPVIEPGFGEWKDDSIHRVENLRKLGGPNLEEFMDSKSAFPRGKIVDIDWPYDDRIVIRTKSNDDATTATRYTVSFLSKVVSKAGRNISGIENLRLIRAGVDGWNDGSMKWEPLAEPVKASDQSLRVGSEPILRNLLPGASPRPAG